MVMIHEYDAVCHRYHMAEDQRDKK